MAFAGVAKASVVTPCVAIVSVVFVVWLLQVLIRQVLLLVGVHIAGVDTVEISANIYLLQISRTTYCSYELYITAII